MSFRKIQIAFQASIHSTFTKQPMGCAIFEGKKVVAKGCNYFCGSGHSTMHAEADAIEKLARRHGLLKPLRKMLSSIPIASDIPSYLVRAYSMPQYRKGR